jgi:CBS domain-containing protein
VLLAYEDAFMFVKNMLSAAVKRLVSVGDDVPLIDAAKPLSDFNIDLVVVCNADGRLAGIITKTDVIRQICLGAGYTTAASDVMMRNVILCHPSDPLRDVWAVMKERSVKNIPVISQDSQPIGVLNARDVLEVLMEETEYEEALLRDYVMSVGYF